MVDFAHRSHDGGSRHIRRVGVARSPGYQRRIDSREVVPPLAPLGTEDFRISAAEPSLPPTGAASTSEGGPRIIRSVVLLAPQALDGPTAGLPLTGDVDYPPQSSGQVVGGVRFVPHHPPPDARLLLETYTELY
eukprot:3086196-Heterocapsa_arctica.AAC.1